MRSIINILGFVALIVAITLNSCEKEYPNKCNVSNPAEEINWLKEEICDVKQDEYSYYVMASYKGETVFYYGNCNPAINYVSILQNCIGDNLGYTNDFYAELTDITVLWKHVDSKCNFQE